MKDENFEPIEPEIEKEEGEEEAREDEVLEPIEPEIRQSSKPVSSLKRVPQRNNGKPKKPGQPNKYTPYMAFKLAKKYFEACDNTVIKVDKNGNEIRKPKLKSGLLAYLKVGKTWFHTKRQLPEWAEVVEYIDAQCENSIETGILVGDYNATAGIFNLKNNHGQVDKTEVKSDVDNKITIVFGD